MSITDTTIADRVTVLQEQSAAHLPPPVFATFGAQVAGLAAAGVPDGVAVAGSAMPVGVLLDAHGERTTLEAARAGKSAVIVFYRGDWCPYCNLTLRAYQEKLVGELEARGVVLIAVSPQKPDGALSVTEKDELTFAVLSDPGNQLGGQLGILMAPDDDVRAAQLQLGLTVADTNADGTDTLPMPTVVIVDAAGTIRWIDVHPDFTTRTEPGEILAAIDASTD
jgi:peroxiredoxin